MFSRREFQAALLVGGLAFIGFGIWRYQHKPSMPAQGPLVVGVLPLTNLSADAGLDWVGGAAQTVMCMRAETLRSVRAVPVRSAGEAAASGAVRLLHGSYTGSGDKLSFQMDVEDLPRHEMLPGSRSIPAQPLLAALGSATVVPVALASGEAVESFPTRSARAIEAFGTMKFDQAVEADPSMSIAWRALAETSAQRNDPALKSILDRGSAASAQFQPLERWRWNALAARLTGDRAKLADALAGLSQAQPDNPAAMAQAASAAVNARRLSQGIALYEATVRLLPRQGEMWNLLGYAYAYAGRQDDALRAMGEYAKVDPRATNALDSMGEVQLRGGRFNEAAQSFEQAYAREPGFNNGYALFKAAVARRWAGDPAAAQALFDKYAKTLNPFAAGLERAAWLYFIQKPAEARDVLRGLAASQPQLKPAIDRRVALDDIGKFPTAPQPDLYRAIWLSARGDYAQAEPLWRKIRASLSPTEDDLSREMLLQCLLKLGKKDEAAKLAAVYPLPRAPGEVLNNPSVLALATANRAR